MNNQAHSTQHQAPSTITLLALTSSLLALPSSLSAAVDQRWTCETSRVEPVYFNAYHGETLKLDAKLLSNGRPVTNVTTASFLWQTNGMGSAWWQTNATIVAGHVKATFTPAMDPGASAVTFFFQVTDQDGSNYRPAGKLYLVKALGDNPVFPDIPPPGGTIDFSLLTLVNAPWTTLEAAQSAVSTGVNEALNAVANESNRAERTYAKLSDIPSVPSISGLATTGEVAAAKAEAQAAAEATAAATYQPLAGMAEYAKLSDIPSVPSIAGLATTGEVAAAAAAAQAAAESTAAATYQPLAGMADYAKLSDIPQVPSIAGLATTGEVAAAQAEAQAAAESTAAATYQPLAAMIDYAQKHEVPEVELSGRTLTVNGSSVIIPSGGGGGGSADRIDDGTNTIDAAGNIYTNDVKVGKVRSVTDLSVYDWPTENQVWTWTNPNTGETVTQSMNFRRLHWEDFMAEHDFAGWIDSESETSWPGQPSKRIEHSNLHALTGIVYVVSFGFGADEEYYAPATRQAPDIVPTSDTIARTSSLTNAISAKRDLTNNVCFSTSITLFRWTSTDPRCDAETLEELNTIQPVYGGENWLGFSLHDGRSSSEPITDENALVVDFIFYDDDSLETESFRATAKRSITAVSNETFVTESYVNSQLQPPPVTSVNSQTGAVTLSASDVGAAPQEEVEEAKTAANEANAFSFATYNFMTGGRTNCWWSGTNYTFGADAATRHKFAWEPGMDAATVPCSMALYEIRDGVRECVWDQKHWTSWYWSFKAQQMEATVQGRIDALGNAVTNDAMYAWAKRYASDGVRNPDPSTTCIDTPTVTLSPGFRWETIATVSGAAYWTIVGNGAVIGGSGTNATLKIRDMEGKEVMTITKGKHRLEWLEEGEIVGQMTDAQGRVCFDMLADAQPTGYFSTTVYAEDFVAETDDDCPADYEWEDIGSGKWRIHYLLKPGIDAVSCFAKFLVEVEGQTVIRYNAGQEIQGGLIYNGVKIAPDISGSPAVGTVIQWKVVR